MSVAERMSRADYNGGSIPGVFGYEDQERVPLPSRKGGGPDAPAPKNLDPKPIRDRMIDRMKKVDPKQSERYRQRTGE